MPLELGVFDAVTVAVSLGLRVEVIVGACELLKLCDTLPVIVGETEAVDVTVSEGLEVGLGVPDQLGDKDTLGDPESVREPEPLNVGAGDSVPLTLPEPEWLDVWEALGGVSVCVGVPNPEADAVGDALRVADGVLLLEGLCDSD